MSTRATYQFIPEDSRFTPAVTIYIHHDGYPEGAAVYLEDAHCAETFIRRNDAAQITASHEIHGDTEYRYNIYLRPSKCRVDIKAFERQGYGEDAFWMDFFDGPIESFLERYQNTPTAKNIDRLPEMSAEDDQ